MVARSSCETSIGEIGITDDAITLADVLRSVLLLSEEALDLRASWVKTKILSLVGFSSNPSYPSLLQVRMSKLLTASLISAVLAVSSVLRRLGQLLQLWFHWKCSDI